MKYKIDPTFQSSVHRTYQDLSLPINRPTPRFPKGDIDARRQGSSFAKAVLALEPEILGVVKTRDYRLAPEVRHPTPIEDCYAVLLWLHSNAKNLGVDNSRIAVVGLSAGGGLAAALSLMARDRGLHPPIAKQILLTPMLDDRNTETDAELLPFTTWTWDDNWTGWNALLDGMAGSSGVSAYAAPARAEDLKGLPPTYVDMGSLDIFAKEAEAFVERLKEAGVDVESIREREKIGVQLFSGCNEFIVA
ncbi:hypothetical protein BLS_009199 [Venturia inaequalis]|uniref:Alpha/beta hydrolase fold-3 domain-containing protein n=1 Tax=Venturia inaequalis TaxID=5025 RepID=A0A8H3U5A0_VENIN|nr:hypothetical protein BLS_009199 [Venturia inaequalis]